MEYPREREWQREIKIMPLPSLYRRARGVESDREEQEHHGVPGGFRLSCFLDHHGVIKSTAVFVLATPIHWKGGGGRGDFFLQQKVRGK
jgi:hypothetical protein